MAIIVGRRGDAGRPGVIEDGQNGGEDDANSVGVSEVGHVGEIAFNLLWGFRAGVAGDVIGTCEDDDGFGLECDDILAETQNHLRRSLAADATVDVRLAGEVFCEFPAFGDGISHEYHAAFTSGRSGEDAVGFSEFSEPGPVFLELSVVLDFPCVRLWFGDFAFDVDVDGFAVWRGGGLDG